VRLTSRVIQRGYRHGKFCYRNGKFRDVPRLGSTFDRAMHNRHRFQKAEHILPLQNNSPASMSRTTISQEASGGYRQIRSCSLSNITEHVGAVRRELCPPRLTPAEFILPSPGAGAVLFAAHKSVTTSLTIYWNYAQIPTTTASIHVSVNSRAVPHSP
jgi:hypothetical protein